MKLFLSELINCTNIYQLVISFVQTRSTLIWCLLVHLWWRASVHPLFHLSPGGHQPLRLSRGNKAGSRDASTISRPSFDKRDLTELTTTSSGSRTR